jgi:hypothetical protein
MRFGTTMSSCAVLVVPVVVVCGGTLVAAGSQTRQPSLRRGIDQAQMALNSLKESLRDNDRDYDAPSCAIRV